MPRPCVPLLLALALACCTAAAGPPPVGTPAPRPAADAARPGTITWEQLVPEVVREHYQAGPPPAVHDYLSGESGLAAQQPQDYSVNAALDGRSIRLPGFIVPLELDAEGRVTEFFLVPYYGACIHVPPPAPNQMLYVTYPRGLTLASMYAAYWISGRITTHTRQSKLGSAAYALAATGIEEYRY
jgi:hypothetical protein